MRRRLKAELAQWDLPMDVQRVALAAYVLAGYDATASVKYLTQYGHKRRWRPLTEDDLTRTVEDLFLNTDLAEIDALTNFQEPSDGRALELAAIYVREAKVVTWAQGLNNERGVAPSTRLLLQRAEASRLELPESARPRSLGMRVSNHARKWAQRLRKRWGGRFGSIPAREKIPLEEMQAKASTFQFQSRLFRLPTVSRAARINGELEFRGAWRVQSWVRAARLGKNTFARLARSFLVAPGATFLVAFFVLRLSFFARRKLSGSGTTT